GSMLRGSRYPLQARLSYGELGYYIRLIFGSGLGLLYHGFVNLVRFLSCLAPLQLYLPGVCMALVALQFLPKTGPLVQFGNKFNGIRAFLTLGVNLVTTLAIVWRAW